MSLLLSLRSHLDLQLLHHLHLHPALGRAPVIQGMLCVEVSSEGGGGREEIVGPVFPAVTTLPSSKPAHGLESRQTEIHKEGKGVGKKTGQRRKQPSSHPPLMSLLKSPLQRDLIANELIK